MMKFHLKAAILGASALALSCELAGGALAAAPKTNANDKESPASPTAAAVLNARLSDDLAAWGRATKSPQALIVSAQILASVGGKDEARTKTSQGGTSQAAAAPKTDKPAVTVASLLDEARTLAGPDQALQVEITRVAALESRGVVGIPPVRHADRVLAGRTDTYALSFRGGETAVVYVKGDGDTDLDLDIDDQNGNHICADNDNTDTMVCSWTPAFTGSFNIQIKNYGLVYNNYILLTN